MDGWVLSVSKQIKVSDSIYDTLLGLKGDDQSFSEVIGFLLDARGSEPVTTPVTCVLTDEDKKAIKAIVDKAIEQAKYG